MIKQEYQNQGKSVSNKHQKYKKWTQQEKNQLMALYQQYGNDWEKIANYFPQTTSKICQSLVTYYIKIKQKPRKNRNHLKRGKQYTKQQDQLVLNLYSKYPEQWSKISQNFDKRTPKAIYDRYRHLNKFHLTSPIIRDWTKEQDQLLLKLVNILNFDWQAISKCIQKCDSNNCYNRYKSLIDERRVWRMEEDNKLIELFQKYDTDWEQISKQLGRSISGCYCRFNKLKTINLQKQWSQQQYDELLEQYHLQQGNWKEIQKKLPQFSIRQCYFKYYQNYQAKVIKK